MPKSECFLLRISGKKTNLAKATKEEYKYSDDRSINRLYGRIRCIKN